MAYYRYTLLMQFNETSPPAGFSESWENQETSDAQARNQLNTLVNARKACLSNAWTILSGRISKLSYQASPSPGRIKQSLVQALTCPAGVVGLLGASDTPWTAALIEMSKFTLPASTASTRPRYQQVRGIPDTWWDGSALSIPAGDQAALQGFFTYLISIAQMGQVRISDAALILQRYRGICIKRISSRRIGRPFGLRRGRRSAAAAPSA